MGYFRTSDRIGQNGSELRGCFEEVLETVHPKEDQILRNESHFLGDKIFGK